MKTSILTGFLLLLPTASLSARVVIPGDLRWERDVSKLIAGLTNPDRTKCLQATGGVARLGPAGKAAVPALIQVLRDGDESCRRGAMGALGAIGPEARAAVPSIVKFLAAKDQTVRLDAASALAGIGVDTKAAVPALIDALQSMDPGPRREAMLILARIGPEAKAAVGPLVKEFLNEAAKLDRGLIGEIRIGWASAALAKIGPAARPALEELLNDPNPLARKWAVYGLMDLRPVARSSVLAIQTLLADDDEDVVFAVELTLKRLMQN